MVVLTALAQTQAVEKGQNKDCKLKSCEHVRRPGSKRPRLPARVRRLQATIEIRSRLSKGDRHKAIMSDLSLPESTYFRYLRRAYATDRQALEVQSAEMLPLELMTLRDRLLGSYRRLLRTCEDGHIPVRDRLKSEALACQVAVALARLSIESPLIVAGNLGDRLQDL